MKKLTFFLFAISGALGLIYQVSWSRKLLLVFGSTTHSLTVVISTFMAGLAIGSFILGHMSDKSKSPIKFWGKLELAIGFSALSFLVLFPHIQSLYAPSGLFTKFIISSLLIFPATFFMGGTLPALIKAYSAASTSILYALNTFGAFMGTLISAYILIEVLGLNGTILLAAVINIIIGVLALRFLPSPDQKFISKSSTKFFLTSIQKPGTYLAIFIFFLSGGISFSYEILWTRLLIPSLGTFIYAFALILATILIGVAIGAYLSKYLKHINSPLTNFALLQFGIGAFAFLSLIAAGSLIALPQYTKLFLTIFPSSLMMGATFPVMVDLVNEKKKIGQSTGFLYAINTLGSIMGPIVTSFYLIPLLGATNTMVTLALINICSAIVLGIFVPSKTRYLAVFSFAFIAVFFISKNYRTILIEPRTSQKIKESSEHNWDYVLYEDQVATTFAFSGATPQEKGLIIDGVQTTTLTTDTKLLSHLPILIHDNPKDLLVIAFGMGTTFRSALSYGLNVDAIELVPSVPKTFTLFYEDAEQVLSNPKGHIIINDGRNYVLLTDNKYDIIVVDPPPPINASGTTVLYSKEFYQDSLRVLNPNGIFVQWFWYGASEDDFKMLFASMREVFPHILIAVSPEGRGVYFLGSRVPLNINKNKITTRFSGKAYSDLNEWTKKPLEVPNIINLFVGDENTVDRFIENATPVTDNFPRTEYFFLRHKLFPKEDISADWVHPISEDFWKKIQ